MEYIWRKSQDMLDDRISIAHCQTGCSPRHDVSARLLEDGHVRGECAHARGVRQGDGLGQGLQLKYDVLTGPDVDEGHRAAPAAHELGGQGQADAAAAAGDDDVRALAPGRPRRPGPPHAGALPGLLVGDGARPRPRGGAGGGREASELGVAALALAGPST